MHPERPAEHAAAPSSSPDDPLVTIVVLNWNGLADTKICLQSIRNQSYRHFETIIVDNGSVDGSVDYLSGVADIKFVPLKENLGFTGGHIEGFKHANGDYIAILNNDLKLHKDWLREVVETMRALADAGAVGGKLYKWDEANPVDCEENEFYTWQEVDLRTGGTRTLLTGSEPCWVDSISGAALLLNRKAIDRVGYLDNDFFAYYEETDLIARMLRAGLRAYYTPAAKAWHAMGGSSEGGTESPFNLYLKHRNRYIFAVKNFDEPYISRFLHYYRKGYYRAQILRRFFSREDFDALVRAHAWVRKNARAVAAKRTEVLDLGTSYIDKLATFKHCDVTIVIPCYNYAQYVGEAIESALAQTIKPRSVIVIDDGSTDDSLSAINEFRSSDPLTVISKPNEGTVATKNLGLRLAKTHWIIFLDADDVLPPDYLEKTLEAAFRENADVVYTDFQYFGAKSEHVTAGEMSRIRMLRENFVHNSALIKTTVARMVGGYKKELKYGLEDWELYLSIARIRAKFAYAKGVDFQYRQHNVESRNSNEHFRETRKAISRLHPGVRPFRYYGVYKRIQMLLKALRRKGQ
jgi:GT2 family glycosyltransferase